MPPHTCSACLLPGELIQFQLCKCRRNTFHTDCLENIALQSFTCPRCKIPYAFKTKKTFSLMYTTKQLMPNIMYALKLHICIILFLYIFVKEFLLSKFSDHIIQTFILNLPLNVAISNIVRPFIDDNNIRDHNLFGAISLSYLSIFSVFHFIQTEQTYIITVWNLSEQDFTFLSCIV